jgi:hypothetical protein
MPKNAASDRPSEGVPVPDSCETSKAKLLKEGLEVVEATDSVCTPPVYAAFVTVASTVHVLCASVFP